MYVSHKHVSSLVSFLSLLTHDSISRLLHYDGFDAELLIFSQLLEHLAYSTGNTFWLLTYERRACDQPDKYDPTTTLETILGDLPGLNHDQLHTPAQMSSGIWKKRNSSARRSRTIAPVVSPCYQPCSFLLYVDTISLVTFLGSMLKIEPSQIICSTRTTAATRTRLPKFYTLTHSSEPKSDTRLSQRHTTISHGNQFGFSPAFVVGS